MGPRTKGTTTATKDTKVTRIKVKDHKCEYCNQAFSRSEHLSRHIRRHTKEKPFVCDKCSLAFSRNDMLRRHQRTCNRADQLNGQKPLLASASPKNIQPTIYHSTTLTIDQPSPLLRTFNFQLNPQQSPTGASPTSNGNGAQNGRSIGSSAGLGAAHTGGVNGTRSILFTSANDTVPTVVQSMELNGATNGSSTPSAMGGFHVSPDTVGSQEFELQSDISFGDVSWMDNIDHIIMDHYNVPGMNEGGMETTGFYNINTERPSVLSRPNSPRSLENNHRPYLNEGVSVSDHQHQLVKSKFESLELPKNLQNAFTFPSRHALARLLNGFFIAFDKHMPMVHQESFQVEHTPVPLILAMICHGAVYSFENVFAKKLYLVSRELMEHHSEDDLWVLQTYMMLIAFGAWSGKPDLVKYSLCLLGKVAGLIPTAWNKREKTEVFDDWHRWIRKQELTSALYILSNLICATYNVSPIVLYPKDIGLPCFDEEWHAKSELEWKSITAKIRQDSVSRNKKIVEILAELANNNAASPEMIYRVEDRIGNFGCHMIINCLLNGIWHLSQNSWNNEYLVADQRKNYINALKKWQLIWEQERESNSKFEFNTPVPFNSTAQLRLAYMKLNADFSSIGSSFLIYESPDALANEMMKLPAIARSMNSIKAAHHSCLALRAPVSMGLNALAHTGIWFWSIQHSISYLHCALFLCKWLLQMENISNPNEAEQRVLDFVAETLREVPDIDSSNGTPHGLASRVASTWSKLFACTTMWEMQPKMAQALMIYASKIESLESRDL